MPAVGADLRTEGNGQCGDQERGKHVFTTRVLCASSGADSGVYRERDWLAVVVMAVVRNVAVFARVAVARLCGVAMFVGVHISPGDRQRRRKRGEETAQP